MATYQLIASSVASGGAMASAAFGSIPSTYTDLVLRASTRDTQNQVATSVNIKINSDSSALYSETNLNDLDIQDINKFSSDSMRRFLISKGFLEEFA